MPHKDPEVAKAYHQAYRDKQAANGYWARYRVEHSDQIKVNDRKRALKREYGLTPEDVEQMVANQQGLCAICKQPETDTYPSGVVKNLSIDHDHITGKVRGLLCRSCNVGLGNLGDDLARVQAAAAYLEYHQTSDA